MGETLLTLAGIGSALAALAHVVCVIVGGPAYRLMGAGERMARAAEAGHWQPAAVTLAIASLLAVWAVLAFSGAGLLPLIPFTRPALVLISAVYLARGMAFPLLMPAFPDNSLRFWLVSSAMCLVLGGLHAWGVVLRWAAM
ncbi:MAG: hypothetical protein EP308_09180 [Burkholderiales bacterium]|nr:MAG: hypothetical protein EP308_09180 [Burkholderiales bacterium]